MINPEIFMRPDELGYIFRGGFSSFLSKASKSFRIVFFSFLPSESLAVLTKKLCEKLEEKKLNHIIVDNIFRERIPENCFEIEQSA